jgi:hypothetical protein
MLEMRFIPFRFLLKKIRLRGAQLQVIKGEMERILEELRSGFSK